MLATVLDMYAKFTNRTDGADSTVLDNPLFLDRLISLNNAGLVGSPFPSGNKHGNVMVAKKGVVYSLRGSSPTLGQSILAPT